MTGLSTREVTRTLHRLLAIEVLIGGAAVLVAVIATTYGVRFSLRRLRRVTATAQEVAAELSPEGAGLDRRVDERRARDRGRPAGHVSFNTMLAAVETQFAARVESEQRMRQFLADASHELRTPLTSIRGYAELARMQRAIGERVRRQPRPHRVRGHAHVAAGRGPAACSPAATPTATRGRCAAS